MTSPKETTLKPTDDVYTAFSPTLASIARADERSITIELSADPLAAYELPSVLRAYRTTALAILRAVTAPLAADVDDDVKIAYVQTQLARESRVALDNATERAQRAQNVATAEWKDYVASLRRRARFAELAARQEGRQR
jgi:hypothetical protein